MKQFGVVWMKWFRMMINQSNLKETKTNYRLSLRYDHHSPVGERQFIVLIVFTASPENETVTRFSTMLLTKPLSACRLVEVTSVLPVTENGAFTRGMAKKINPYLKEGKNPKGSVHGDDEGEQQKGVEESSIALQLTERTQKRTKRVQRRDAALCG